MAFKLTDPVLLPVAVAVAAALGALLRFGADSFVGWALWPPYISTFCVNLGGCFLVGVLSVFVSQKAVFSPAVGTILTAGFCGGFTTFSAYALQTASMLLRGQFGLSMVYFMMSPMLGLGAVWGGIWLAQKLP